MSTCKFCGGICPQCPPGSATYACRGSSVITHPELNACSHTHSFSGQAALIVALLLHETLTVWLETFRYKIFVAKSFL